MSIQSNFPSIKPTLMLDFANTKELDPRITFTRASTATYFNAVGVMQTAASGVARFQHDPVTLDSLGLQLEGQRTNLLTYSDQFDNAAWGKVRATITADTLVSPDGTLNADKLVEDTTASSSHYIRVNPDFTFVADTTYTLTVYLKAAERTTAQVALNMFTAGNLFVTSRPSIDVNLTNGTIISASSGVTSSSITNVGSGWYRCSVSGLMGATGGSQTTGVFILDSGNSNTYTGDGTSGIYLWGAQLEVGNSATSYIPTVATQVTRAADAASITGANFSSWYNQSEGTFYLDATMFTAQYDFSRWFLNSNNASGSTNEAIGFVNPTSTTNVIASVTSGGASSFSVATSLQLGSEFKASLSYKVDDFAASVNNTSTQTNSSGALPSTADRLYINGDSDAGSGSESALTIKKIAYYPIRATNTSVQGLTS